MTGTTPHTPTGFVRRDLASLDPNGPEIASLRQGFQVLRDRSAANPNDPRGWLVQANIHAISCSHSNWWFVSWHRAYLWYFEQILREASGDPTLTLPYWNWTDNPTFPQVFMGSGNPLNDPNRNLPNTPADPAFVGQPEIDTILNTSDFGTFGGAESPSPRVRTRAGMLEGVPHNYIHRYVGGDMANQNTAARDPIFWLHHANVDRLWAEWAARNPGQSPTSANWLNAPFQFFDVTGTVVTITTDDVLSTLNLGYQYDTLSGTPDAILMEEGIMSDANAREPELVAQAASGPSVISGQPITVTLSRSAPAADAITAEGTEESTGTLRLDVEGVEAPMDNLDVGVRVFLNLPDADASTPHTSPHYVSSFTFFEHMHGDASDEYHQGVEALMGQGGDAGHEGHEGHGENESHAHGTQTFSLNLTPTIQKLQAAGLYQAGDPLDVTLVAIPLRSAAESDALAADAAAASVTIPFQGVSLTRV